MGNTTFTHGQHKHKIQPEILQEAAMSNICISLIHIFKNCPTEAEKLFFHPMLPDFRKSTAFWKVPQRSPICPSCRWKMRMGHLRNTTDRGKRKYWEKHLSQCHFFHHISHRVTSARNLAFALTGRCVTAWLKAYTSSTPYLKFSPYLNDNTFPPPKKKKS